MVFACKNKTQDVRDKNNVTGDNSRQNEKSPSEL